MRCLACEGDGVMLMMAPFVVEAERACVSQWQQTELLAEVGQRGRLEPGKAERESPGLLLQGTGAQGLLASELQGGHIRISGLK